MAQFDVHRNIGRQRESIPYVVVVQSALFDGYQRRVVVPLVRLDLLGSPAALDGLRVNPVFSVEGVDVVLHPLEIVSVAIAQLGEKVASLAQEGDRIVDALDDLLTRSGHEQKVQSPLAED